MKYFLIPCLVLCIVLGMGLGAQGAAKKSVKSAKQAAPKAETAEPAIANPPAEASESSRWPEGKTGDAAKAYSNGDYETARRLWQELAQTGDAEAMNNLGVLYDQGIGVERDPGMAARWFADSANAGNPAGMSNYGRLLEQGRGLPANPEEAARWFDQAARKDQPEAQFNLGFLYEHGRGVPRDDAAAAAWYSRAGSLRQKDALARLGHFYRIGKGVPQDGRKAVLLLYAAAMEGSQAAIEELEELAKESPQKAQAILFGQKLDSADRTGMREALKKAGAKISREDDQHICDVYEAAGIAPGAREMAACYGPEGRLGFVKIDYPAPDKNRADAVLKMVESRFGAPTAGENDNSSLWNLGSIIVATQYLPDHKLVSLMYMVPKVYHQTRAQ